MKTDLNPTDFRAPNELNLETLRAPRDRKPPRHRRGEAFLKGPIPWDWMQAAMMLPGKAVHVAVLLWRESGMKRNRTIRFNLSAAGKFGIHPASAKRGLRALAAAKLVAINCRPGHALEVTLCDYRKT